MNEILNVTCLCKNYGKNHILNSVTMQINKGDIYGFIGKNGAGKTTLMRIVMGLANYTSGEIALFGENEKNKIMNVRHKVSSVIETPSFYPNLTAKQNLKVHCYALGIKHTDKIATVLNEVGLPDTKKKKVKNFSLGMKQRLGIARALLNESEFILLDEPTNGLDPDGIKDFRELVQRLNKERGITFLISSHYLNELQQVCTKFGFLQNGTIIEEISKQALIDKIGEQIEIKVSNTEKAKTILHNNFPNILCSEQNEFLLLKSKKINIGVICDTFVCNQVQILNINTHEISLEEYFFNIEKPNEVNKNE